MAFNPFMRDAADLDGSQQWDQARQYLEAVLHYAFEGNTDVDFDVHLHNGDAMQRQWYHAPWLHRRCNGREYIHGLTRERRSPPEELAPVRQAQRTGLSAVHNAPGGQVVGRVWADPVDINLLDASFPEGTVTFKLLYTMADPVSVPSCEAVQSGKRTPSWNDAPPNQRCNQNDTDRTVSSLSVNLRKIHEVRLMQVDVAVRDARATSAAGVQTNWAFGTFVYDGVTMASDSTADMSPSERWAISRHGSSRSACRGAPIRGRHGRRSYVREYDGCNQRVARGVGDKSVRRPGNPSVGCLHEFNRVRHLGSAIA